MLANPDASIVHIGGTELGRPFRLGVLTGAGEDPALTQILAAGWADLRTALAPRVLLQMVWVGAAEEAEQTVKHHGFVVVPHTTAPIGGAWNNGLGLLKESGVDAVLFMEPNSIADKGMINRYAELLLDEYFSVSLFDAYLIHPESGRAVFWTGRTGPDKGKPILTGRCMSRPWLDQLEWAPWPAQAQTLEVPLIKRLEQLAGRADSAGEYRTCGCLGWQFHPIVLRDGTPEGFFHQEGEAAEARQVSTETLLATHDAPEFTAALQGYRRGETAVKASPSAPPASMDQAPVPSPEAEAEAEAEAEVEATVTPAEATVTPAEATVTPAEATVTPAEATVTPAEATVTPTEATVTPAEAVTKWMSEGEAAFAEGQLVDAERAFRRALAIDPTRADVLNNLAVARHAQGDAAGAERLLLKAVVFDLEAVDPFVSLTAIAQAEGRLGLALRYAIEGLERGTQPELLALTRELADKTGNADLMAELDALLAATNVEAAP